MARLMLYRLTVHALTIAKPKWYKTCTKKTVAQALTIDMVRCCVMVTMRTVAQALTMDPMTSASDMQR